MSLTEREKEIESLRARLKEKDETLQELQNKLAEAEKSCSELVEALENSRDVFEHLITHHRVVAGHQIAISCFERINEALANHAKRMKGG